MPLGEDWWSAVLKEEERQAPRRERRAEAARERENDRGLPEDWSWARDLFDADDRVSLKVIGCNRGGLLVEARSLRGFVPISHLVSISEKDEHAVPMEQMAELVGGMIELKVIEFDPERGRLVFSERAAQADPGTRLQLLSSLHPRDRVSGMVTNITRFGVFVDLGGVEGLIHVSELSWGRVRHPADVVKIGEQLEVEVISIDADMGRVGLSLKETLPDPWKTVDERYCVGDLVNGIVTNVVKFGAFLGIEEGLEGLIHVSELGPAAFHNPRSVLQEGNRVSARIIHIDAAGRRLGLSLRNISQDQPMIDGEETAQNEQENEQAESSAVETEPATEEGQTWPSY